MITDSVAAATAVAGYDLFQGKRYQVSTALRHLKGLALVGSAVANDTQVDIYAGDTFISSLRNTTAGAGKAPQTSTDLVPVDVGVEGGESLHAIVVTAPTTNAVVWSLDIDGV